MVEVSSQVVLTHMAPLVHPRQTPLLLTLVPVTPTPPQLVPVTQTQLVPLAPPTVVIQDDPPAMPLDLSCKGASCANSASCTDSFGISCANSANLEPFAINRTNSCSSTTSSSSYTSSLGSCGDDERRLKRKEQNKTAAHNYRQRKKSFSDMIENEREQLARRNAVLKVQKKRLEDQISRMRGLLDQAIQQAKRKEEQEEEEEETRSEPPVSPMPLMSVMGPPMPLAPSEAQHIIDNSLEPMPRGRKYTWPMSMTGKERKKEQNKLASRRFRQRRKMEQSHCELEVHQLEEYNKRLRENCEELEGKINMLKDLMNKKQDRLQVNQPGQELEVGEK